MSNDIVIKLEPLGGGGKEEDDGDILVKEEEEEPPLSAQPEDIAALEHLLREIGFLDPTLGVRERQCLRDPMLTILYRPTKEVELPAEGEGVRTTTVIDELLRAAHEEFQQSLGDMYTESDLVQETMDTLMRSKDTPAKQMMLLCMLAIDEGLQQQLACHYPADDGPEVKRLDVFIPVIKAQMEETFNVAYVNVPRPSIYNVETLLVRFLVACAQGYPG